MPKQQDNTIEKVVQTSLTERVSGNSGEILKQSIEGDEKAFQQVLRVAFQSTRINDWVAFGDKPYLTVTGAQKMALRFGVSLKFDRDKDGNALIQREEFEDPKHGKGYVYTTFGKAVLGNREFEAIGTASTLDSFLGMKDKNTAMPIHEAMQDAKKKSVSNFYNNAIQAVLGVKGFTWEELKAYGITQANKSSIAFKAKESKEPLSEAPKIDKNRPYWTFDTDDGTRWLYVKSGNHFPENWCVETGFKATKKDPSKFGAKYSEALLNAVETQFEAAEAFGVEKGPY